MKKLEIVVDVSSYIPLYKQIYDQVIFFLEIDIIKPGDKLYSIKILAKKLGVSVNTVSKAYRMLELRGYLVKRRGLGAYITQKK